MGPWRSCDGREFQIVYADSLNSFSPGVRVAGDATLSEHEATFVGAFQGTGGLPWDIGLASIEASGRKTS